MMEVMTAPRRLLAAVLAMFILMAFALLLWRWLPGPGSSSAASSATGPVAHDRFPAGPVTAAAPPSRLAPLPPPRLRPAVSGPEEPPPPPMPEGLAQDLEIFDGVQLKAELESIALSHPEVRVLEAACSGLPCRAEAASTSGEELNAFALAVHRRFQGYVSIRMPPPKPVPGHELRATFWVGTTPSAPP
jgi:hypothetical protein